MQKMFKMPMLSKMPQLSKTAMLHKLYNVRCDILLYFIVISIVIFPCNLFIGEILLGGNWWRFTPPFQFSGQSFCQLIIKGELFNVYQLVINN